MTQSSTPPFKVGDLIRLSREDMYGYERPAGTAVEEVASVDPKNGTIRLKGGAGPYWADMFERVES